MTTIIAADTITKLGPDARGAVIVSASHGGVYPAYLASKSGARAVIFNDAGVGKDRAGIGSLDYCEALGMAAAVVSHRSARIGDSADMLARGVISHANAPARALGVEPGMACRAAAEVLTRAALPDEQPQPYKEARLIIAAEPGRLRVVCIDSASLVAAEDAGQIVITGSHGGLVGGNPAMALQVDARAALFNDAGVGAGEAGVTRLPALDKRGIAAATVAADSARIGDARSTYEDGMLSRVNDHAAALGGRVGSTAREFVAAVQLCG